MKTCTGCLMEKPESSFHWANKEKTRRRGDCNNCCWEKAKLRRSKDPEAWRYARKYAIIKHKYGIDRQTYDSLMLLCQGNCYICGEFMESPHVDHDHRTGKVRGLLCKQCNSGLGMFKDDLVLLGRAISYLGA